MSEKCYGFGISEARIPPTRDGHHLTWQAAPQTSSLPLQGSVGRARGLPRQGLWRKVLGEGEVEKEIPVSQA